jgi:hypothetical protein
MLATNLTTNEVKDSAGTEVEFNRIAALDRSVTFAKSGENPSQPYRLKVSHLETGASSARRRRSLVRFDVPVTGVDGKIENVAAYTVVDAPVGNIAAVTSITTAVAHLISFLATTGAATTVLFDGTGSGSAALINGTL